MTTKSTHQKLSYDEKLRLTNRDALRAVGALVFVTAVWLICGFGLAGLDIKIFHLPLWVVCGLLGTWVAAIVATFALAYLFKDFDLEEAVEVSLEPDEYRGPARSAATPSTAETLSTAASPTAASSSCSVQAPHSVKVVNVPEVIAAPSAQTTLQEGGER